MITPHTPQSQPDGHACFDALTPDDLRKLEVINDLAAWVREFGAGRMHVWLKFVAAMADQPLPCAETKR